MTEWDTCDTGEHVRGSTDMRAWIGEMIELGTLNMLGKVECDLTGCEFVPLTKLPDTSPRCRTCAPPEPEPQWCGITIGDNGDGMFIECQEDAYGEGGFVDIGNNNAEYLLEMAQRWVKEIEDERVGRGLTGHEGSDGGYAGATLSPDTGRCGEDTGECS